MLTTPLRQSLLADALASGATGLLLLLTATWLHPLLGLPSALLRGAGLFLLPFAAWVASQHDSRRAGWVVAINSLWVVDSLLVIVWLRPTVWGTLFVLAQAAVVGALAAWQWSCLTASGSAEWRFGWRRR